MASDSDDLYDDSEFDVDDFGDFAVDDRDVEPFRRSRVVRWTAVLVVASFILAGMSSLFR